jgi:hypothetical protein
MASHRQSVVVAVVAVLPLAGPVAAQSLPPQPNSVTNLVPVPEAVTLHAKITAINPRAT